MHRIGLYLTSEILDAYTFKSFVFIWNINGKVEDYWPFVSICCLMPVGQPVFSLSTTVQMSQPCPLVQKFRPHTGLTKAAGGRTDHQTRCCTCWSLAKIWPVHCCQFIPLFVAWNDILEEAWARKVLLSLSIIYLYVHYSITGFKTKI